GGKVFNRDTFIAGTQAGSQFAQCKAGTGAQQEPIRDGRLGGEGDSACEVRGSQRAVRVPGIDQVKSGKISVDVMGYSVAEFNFGGDAKAAIAGLNRLIYGAEFQAFRAMEIIRVIVVAGRELKAQTQGEVAFFSLWDCCIVGRQPDVADAATARTITFAAVAFMFVKRGAVDID